MLALITLSSTQGANLMAAPIQIELPSAVGPHFYEIYTAAKYYSTTVYVDGRIVPLSNADGNGYFSQQFASGEFAMTGALGHDNRQVLNVRFLRPNSVVKVKFTPSVILQGLEERKLLSSFKEDIFAKAVLTRGRLNNTTTALNAKELGLEMNKAFTSNDVTVFMDQGFTGYKGEVVYEARVNFGYDDELKPATIEDCSLEWKSSPYSFQGTLALNGQRLNKISFDTATTEADYHGFIKPGENKLEIKVTALKEPAEVSIYLSCNMENLLQEALNGQNIKFISFGDLFYSVHVPLVTFKLNKKGSFSEVFSIKPSL